MLSPSAFVGDRSALKYAFRELPVIDVVCRYVTSRETVLQAGGNLGVFPQRLADVFQRVVTCEPDPDNFAAMARNVTATNVERHQVALGDAIGTVGLSKRRRDGKADHHAGIVHVSGHGEISMIRIDDLGLSPDAILLDVEGSELSALRGAVATIARARPVIAVEVNKNLAFVGLTEADVMRFFGAQRYLYVAQSGSDKVFIPSERVQ
jgi:FkbM family methyltransferase